LAINEEDVDFSTMNPVEEDTTELIWGANIQHHTVLGWKIQNLTHGSTNPFSIGPVALKFNDTIQIAFRTSPPSIGGKYFGEFPLWLDINVNGQSFQLSDSQYESDGFPFRYLVLPLQFKLENSSTVTLKSYLASLPYWETRFFNGRINFSLAETLTCYQLSFLDENRNLTYSYTYNKAAAIVEKLVVTNGQDSMSWEFFEPASTLDISGNPISIAPDYSISIKTTGFINDISSGSWIVFGLVLYRRKIAGKH